MHNTRILRITQNKKMILEFLIAFLIFIVCEISIYYFHREKKALFDFKSISKVATLDGGQDGVIYNDYLFLFDSSGICTVYSMADYSMISKFTLDKVHNIAPHSNSVCFSNLYYNEADEYPLLYSNIYNNDKSLPGTVIVYRLTQCGTNFFTELVQIIQVAFTGDGEKWAEGKRPYGNFVVDTDNNDLWVFVMDDTFNTTKFFPSICQRYSKAII